jgi:hypothetical protein
MYTSSSLNTTPKVAQYLLYRTSTRESNAAPAASYRELSGECSMAKPYASLHREVAHEHPMVKELLAELQEIDEKARVEIRFYELIAHVSHIDI